MFFKIISPFESKFPYNVVCRSYQRCAALQNFYSSLKRSPTYSMVFMPTAESIMTRNKTIAGWYDDRLTSAGKFQARCASQLLKQNGYHFDVGFCSMMSRDLSTLCHLFQETEDQIDIHQHWRLNPQAMGAFTGQQIGSVLIEKYGINTVDDALSKYTGSPPPMYRHHLYYEVLRDDERYKKVLPNQKVPMRENLWQVQQRVLPYWIDVIGKQIKLNRKPIIVADDTVLRVLIKYLDNLSDEDAMKLNICKSTPFVYTLDQNLKPMRGKSMQFVDNLVPIKLKERVMDCHTPADTF